MRVLVLVLLAMAFAPVASAQEPCGYERVSVDPVPDAHVGLEMETRDCEGNTSWYVAAAHREGRLAVEWYDDERGAGVGAFEPPRFVWWHEDRYGCMMVVYVAGAVELPCYVGSPPSPPTPPQVPR